MLGLLLALPAAQARESAVFVTGDLNPFIQAHGLFVPADATTTPRGEWSGDVLFGIANNASADTASGELIVLDGETWRIDFVARYGVTERLDAGISVPLIAHRRGAFDRIIYEWHELFGLTNSARDGFDHNELRYAYAREGHALVDIGDQTSGLGDVTLSAGWQLDAGDDGRAGAIHAGIKLPAGDDRALRGSGGTDLWLRMAGSDAVLLAAWKIRLSWAAGLARLGGGGVLGDLRREWVPLGTLAVDRPVGRRLVLKGQIDAHGAFYRSELEELGSSGTQITVGAGIDLGRGGVLDVGLVEDLVSDTIPDFGLHLAWRGWR